MPPGTGAKVTFRRGGGSFTEIRTDRVLTGIGPAIDLRYDAAGGVYRGPANVDIALWDLIGKACGQPIHKLLGGGGAESITPYASMPSTPLSRKLPAGSVTLLRVAPVDTGASAIAASATGRLRGCGEREETKQQSEYVSGHSAPLRGSTASYPELCLSLLGAF